ncbi:hypothetical protein SAMN02746089_02781 [Caldanaerobius fijiensis DSM 17918]|uniref:Uncharacterized protein n=1 Tax=Caldanaerobius fijiensis DSM 17918 TaxID=1121256 RepID=A0A1M5FND2_9THEO|nr:hypothetical protein SAMN02746089_02781 [Caldanaerobius fijiensis DSM 17918]
MKNSTAFRRCTRMITFQDIDSFTIYLSFSSLKLKKLSRTGIKVLESYKSLDSAAEEAL